MATSKRRNPSHVGFVICINNEGYPASLETRQVYECMQDEVAEALDQVRVIDESGEDYLYPREMFVPVELAAELRKLLLAA
jgi:hypothetical protein